MDLQRGSHLAYTSPPELSGDLLVRERPPFALQLRSGFRSGEFHALAALPLLLAATVAIVWRTAARAGPLMCIVH